MNTLAQRLMLIDGDNLVHRGYHALPPLSTSGGQPVGAVYGLVQMLLPLLQSERPDMVLVAFDRPEPTFRHGMDDAYKANRAEMEPELQAQMALTRELVDALGLARLEIPGYEADDIIGAYARRGAQQGDEVTIVSGDRDMVQLVSPQVRVLAPVKGLKEMKLYDEAAVVEEYGVEPRQIPDVKALAGDTSDNISGVPGIGPVGAASLVRDFGDIEGILAHLDDITKPVLRKRLTEHAELARLGKELTTIRGDLPLPDQAPELAWGGPRATEARRLFARLEFGNLLDRTGDWGSEWEGEVAVATAADLEELCRRAREVGHLTLVPATGSGGEAALAIAAGPGRALVWAPAPPADQAGGSLFAEEATGLPDCLAQALADPSLPKWGCRLKEAARLLTAVGCDLRGYDFDAEVADYVQNPARPEHSVLHLAARELGWWVGADAADRSGLPAWQTQAAVEALAVELVQAAELADVQRAGLDSVYREVEMPLVAVLAEMEGHGITVDMARLRELGDMLCAAITAVTDRCFAIAGQEFNLESPKQVGEVLFGVLELPRGKKTKTGWSTGASVLEELATEHEICARILEHRELAKLRSTYVEALIRQADPVSHRIHTTFEQTVTATGRLSSRNPNLQNIPVRTESGREIRACFIAAQGKTLIKADYSQIELRLLAHFCHDENLVAAFRNREDVHTRTAALIYEVEAAAVTPDMRRIAKTVNFAVLYGMGATALAAQLGIPRGEAQRFIEGYFEQLSSVREYLDGVVEAARRDGYVTTLLGRRRSMPELHSPDRQARAYAERAAANTPLQGSAADIVKVAMVRLANLLHEQQPETALLLQVHDELVLEAPDSQVGDVAALVREVMEGVVQLDVPLVVEVAAGPNWRDTRVLPSLQAR